ncbi:MAG: sugar phosphate isomerase/epimerase, partial [Candidatus Hydrogenedentes bacterium]|nr:sugar phosphate isomerase/epimerase [Candidatus Hydrogenedentota bacterium]
LQAASALGIKYVRVGGLSYSDDGEILSELDAFTEQMRALAALLAEFNMTAGYHNHSGGTNVGAVLWDLHDIIRAVNSEHFGSNFDIGHAAVEGAYAGWRINTRLMAPHVRMMAVKDFVWDGDRPRWVPLGEGVVQTVEFLKILHATNFAGPVSIHFEYKTESDDVLLEHIRAASARMRDNLREAGFGS